MNNRVVVTGYSAVTAAGNDIDTTWQAIKDGQTGIAAISEWDASQYDYPLAGEIKNYNSKQWISHRKLLKLLSKQDVIGLHAVNQALAHSQLLEYRETLSDKASFNDRTGIYVGSPGNKFYQQHEFLPLFSHAQGDMDKFANALFEQVQPRWLLKILANNVLAYTGIIHGFMGPNQNIANSGVSGMQAITEAFHEIKTGNMDRALVVGYEATLDPQTLFYFGHLGLLSKQALKAFDKNHDGTLLANGAGAIMLETYASAQQRGATIYGEILAGATRCEAMDMYTMKPDGDGMLRAMAKTLKNCAITPDQLGAICAHGSGIAQSDTSEASAISTILANHNVPISGFKWALGNTITAAGIIETILMLLSLREGNLPGIANLHEAADGCQSLKISNQPQPCQSPIGLVLSRSMASQCACLLVNALS